MANIKVVFKRIESIQTENTDSFIIHSVIISADGFEYRPNSQGTFPPGYFIYVIENGQKQELQAFFPAENILCIYDADLVGT